MKSISAVHQGLRMYQEDRHVCFKYNNMYVFCIFDGHGGSIASEFCKNNTEQVIKYINSIYGIYDLNEVIRKTYAILDNMIMGLNINDGTTSLIVFVTPDRIFFSNAGDSMAMIGFEDDKTEMCSYEHKVGDKSEIKRIEAAGGKIETNSGMHRINGINLSRSLGDKHSKKYIISKPFIKSYKRTSNMRYIFMASDGIWDVMNKDEIHSLIRNNYDMSENDIKNIIYISQLKGSTDNITLTYIDLK